MLNISLQCLDTNWDIHLTFLQIWAMLIEAGFQSLTMILFNMLIRGMLLQMNTYPINVDNDDVHHQALGICKRKSDKVKDAKKVLLLLLQGLQKQSNGKMGDHVIVKPKWWPQRMHLYHLSDKTGRLITWNSKHVCSTNIMSEGYLQEQIKNYQGDWRTIFHKPYPKKCITPQTAPHEYQQGDINKPKFIFP